MNCPYCTKEMETGYLRGGSGYELLWTEEPFKMTSLPTGNDFFVCKASDVYRPIAHLCRACGGSSWTSKNKKAPRISRPAALSTRIYHAAFAAPRQTRPRTPPHLPPAGGK